MGFGTTDFDLSSLPMAAMVSDADDNVVWVNEALCELLHTDVRSLIGAPLAAVLDGREDVLSGSMSRYNMTDDAGQSRWLQCATGLLSGGGLTIRCFTDISELENRQRGRGRFAALALDRTSIDSDTGVLNRLSILQALQTEISRSRRYGNPLSALQLSIPEQGADDAVGRLVESAGQVLRWVDSMGRLTSTSFLVVLPETNHEGAKRGGGKIADCEALPTDSTIVAEEWSGEDSADDFLHRLGEEGATSVSAA